MSYEDIAKVGALTNRIAATATSGSKAIGVQSKNIIFHNAGTSPVFVQTGVSGLTIVYPTTSTGQNGSIVMGGQSQNYKKNNPTDTTVYAICDTGLSTDLLFSAVEGE